MAIDSKASRRIPQTLLMLDVGTAAHARNTLNKEQRLELAAELAAGAKNFHFF